MYGIAVTGATGCIGSALVTHLCDAGYRVLALARTGSGVDPRASFAPYRLGDTLAGGVLEGTELLVHCAYDALEPHLNVEGTRRAFAAARSCGARILLLSSLAAHDEALSSYGRTKQACEALLDVERDAIVRPGLVLAHGGLCGRIEAQIARGGLLPAFAGAAVQTIAIDDLMQALLCVAGQRRTGRYNLADDTPTSLRVLYRSIAERLGVRARIVPLPIGLALGLLRVAHWMRMRLPVDEDRILGIKAMRRYDTAEDARRLGVRVRPFRESIELLYAAR